MKNKIFVYTTGFIVILITPLILFFSLPKQLTDWKKHKEYINHIVSEVEENKHYSITDALIKNYNSNNNIQWTYMSSFEFETYITTTQIIKNQFIHINGTFPVLTNSSSLRIENSIIRSTDNTKHMINLSNIEISNSLIELWFNVNDINIHNSNVWLLNDVINYKILNSNEVKSKTAQFDKGWYDNNVDNIERTYIR